MGVSRQTINKFNKTIRQRIVELCETESPFTNVEIEFDESCFEVRRVGGFRGCGTKGKTTLFRVLKRFDKVYTQIVKGVSAAELMPVIKGKARLFTLMVLEPMRGF